MIEGRKIRYITKVFGRESDGTYTPSMVERKYTVRKFKQYLSAGPLPQGGVRQADLIQFYDKKGLHTVAAEDIVL